MDLEGTISNESLTKVFPIEIWELMLEQVEDTEQILNIFKAIPNLRNLAKGKQFSWLIGEVMPLLFPKFLNFSRDIKQCRLVSKRWKNSIDTCFKEHPDMVPYNLSNINRVDGKYFCYYPLPTVSVNIHKFHRMGYAPTEQHVATGYNPFPARSLKIQLDIPHHMNSETSLADILQFLSHFGQHFLYLDFRLCRRGICSEDEFMGEYIHAILECISKAPNLKSLSIEGWELMRTVTSDHAKKIQFHEMATNLSNLQMLDLSKLYGIRAEIYSYLLSSLITNDNIPTLGIFGDYWDTRYGKLFPNLSELRLNTVNNKYAMDSIRRVLSELEAPNLRKLRLGKFNGLGIYELLNVLVPLRIEVLELVGHYLSEDDEFEGDVLVSSIRDLKLRVYPDHTYQFLTSLPNLTHLSIYYTGEDWHGWEPSEDGSEDSDSQESFGVSFRDFLLENEADPGKLKIVWESLPSLQAISMHGGIWQQYYREYPFRSFKALRSASPGIFCN